MNTEVTTTLERGSMENSYILMVGLHVYWYRWMLFPLLSPTSESLEGIYSVVTCAKCISFRINMTMIMLSLKFQQHIHIYWTEQNIPLKDGI